MIEALPPWRFYIVNFENIIFWQSEIHIKTQEK